MDKLARKSEVRKQLGDQAGFQKYQSKTSKQLAKYEKARKLYEWSTQASALLQKKIDDISNGTLKAGRDFVARNITWVAPIPNVGVTAASIKDYVEIKR